MKLYRFLIVFFGVYCGCVHAGLYPDTKIKHDPVTVQTPDHRVTLEAEITDPARIDQARCYFRIAASAEYLFTPMARTIGNIYNCSLPAIAYTSSSLEYLFVVKNKRSQVIRSRTYVSEVRYQDSLPQQQRFVGNDTVLEVYDELEMMSHIPANISDKKLKLVQVGKNDELFGLKIDIYGVSQVPAALHAMPGYFGGFLVDDKGDVYPAEGYAVDIKPKELSQLDFLLHVLHEDPLNLTDDSWEQSITASVVHNGDSIDIDTSRSNNSIAGRFVGDINSKGDMFVYDKHDNEIWTSYFGPTRQV